MGLAKQIICSKSPVRTPMKPNEDEPNVNIIFDGIRWVVRVNELGIEHAEEFTSERHARSWASGQRLRLNLDLEASAGDTDL